MDYEVVWARELVWKFSENKFFQFSTQSTHESSIIQGSVWSRYNYTMPASIAYWNLQ